MQMPVAAQIATNEDQMERGLARCCAQRPDRLAVAVDDRELQTTRGADTEPRRLDQQPQAGRGVGKAVCGPDGRTVGAVPRARVDVVAIRLHSVVDLEITRAADQRRSAGDHGEQGGKCRQPGQRRLHAAS
jgi:hypothetical protein